MDQRPTPAFIYIEGACVDSHDEGKREIVAAAVDTAPATDSSASATTEEAQDSDAMTSNGEHDPTAPEEPPATTDSGANEPERLQAPLSPGSLIGSYRITRTLRETSGRLLFLVTDSDVSSTAPTESERVFLIMEVPADRTQAVSRIIDGQLRHPRLIAPRELIAQNGARFVVAEGSMSGEITLGVADTDAPLFGPEQALRAGAGLADTLSYLHRNGIAHLHVSPEAIILASGRAYLCGLEDGAMLEDSPSEAGRLVARDSNTLATTLAQLAHVTDAPPAHDDSLAVQTLREVAMRGAESVYSSPEEVAAACGSALQVTPQPLPTPPQATIGVPLHLEAGTATSVGLVRSENQDAVVSIVLDAHDDASRGDAPIGVFLIADGMGGEAHGELASRIAARIVPSQLLSQLILPLYAKPAVDFDQPVSAEYLLSTAGVADTLDHAVTAANQRIREMALTYGQDTGSTLTVVVCAGPQAVLAHLGDSRCYLLRDGVLVRLTDDHTLLARLEAMDHPILEDPTFYVPRNFLYRSLGQEQAPPDLRPFTLAPEDRFVICSDGLWDELDDEAIKSTLATADDPEACARRLVDMANESGGHDNSTAVVVFAKVRSHDAGAHGTEDTTKLPAMGYPDPGAVSAADPPSV
jgi:serine/threonine protein phosphatase PrpC